MTDTQQTPTIYKGSTIQKVTIEVEAEVTEKGQVFVLLPKSRFKIHRESLDRYMLLDQEASK